IPSFFAVTSESSTIRSVRVKPGRSVFTVTPKGATSVARVRANPITAARMLLESIRLSTGCLAAIEPTLRILPQRRSFIPGSATRQNSTTLPRTSAVAWSHASAVSDSNGPAGGPPLLVSRIATPPNRATPSRTSRSGSPRKPTSAGRASTGTPWRAAISSAVARSAASPRAVSTSEAPSAASSSATARPNPRLDAASSATFPRNPSSMPAPPSLLPTSYFLSPEIIVRLVQPVLPRRREDVHVERVLQRLGLVRHVARQVEHLAAVHVHDLPLVVAEPEAKAPLEHVGELLVLVGVLRHDAALLEVHVRQHHPVAGDEAPVEQVGDPLAGELFPGVVRAAGYRFHGVCLSAIGVILPDIVWLKAGTVFSSSSANAAFAWASCRSISSSVASSASVGRNSAPPATSPAPVPTSPESQTRLR